MGGKISGYLAWAYLNDLPALSIVRSGDDAILSWPAVEGFVLQQNPDLSNPNGWFNANHPITGGPTKSAAVPLTLGD